MKLLIDYLTVDQVAELVGYTPLTIRRKIQAGVLPAIRRGRRLLIDRDDLNKLYEPATTTAGD